MNVVAIDFETFYSDDYSLRKMSTEEYIRDPRFETIGVSIAEPGTPTRWIYENIHAELSALNLESRTVVAHNGLFDFAILAWCYNIHPRVMACTLKMARPFHRVSPGLSLAKLSRHYGLPDKGDMVVQMKGKRRSDMTLHELASYGPLYANRDAENCLALFHILKNKLPLTERAAIHITLEMFTKPYIHLNQRKLVDYTREVIARKDTLVEDLQKKLADLVGMPDLPNFGGVDRKAFFKWLRSRDAIRFLDGLLSGRLPRSAKTGEPSLTKTHRITAELLLSDDELVRSFVEARLGTQSSLDETRAKRFLGISTRGLLPVPLNYYGAHTGRFSGTGSINLQNLPSRNGKSLKQCMEAPPGYVLLDVDLSQIEARLCAMFCGEMGLVNQFAQGEDVYSSYASERFGFKVTKANKRERMLGKVSILSLQYGVGAESYREMARIQGGIILLSSEASMDVNFYRNKFTRIRHMWFRLDDAIQAMIDGANCDINEWARVEGTRIIRPNGMALDYPGIFRVGGEASYCSTSAALLARVKSNMTGSDISPDAATRLYGAKVLENIIQALASDIIREKMVVLRGVAPVLLQVHDNIVLLVREQDIHATHSFVHTTMTTPPVWMPGLPLDCEIGIGYNYGDLVPLDRFNQGERA